MLCNGNVPDANSPINFKNDSFCPASSRDFSILTTHMRYGHETVKFWQIGYRLFHGKFLRFMSGIRNFGQVLDGTSERGFFDPLKSKLIAP
jgi:hypothetical protein